MFHDRTDAGRQLGRRLSELNKGGEAVVVVGLPRGGVPVAFEVARELSAPLDVILVRKLGVPFQPELGMGAIGENGVRVLNDEIVKAAQVNEGQIATIESRERNELERRARRYRAGRIRTPLSGRVVVVVDDGVATGSTAKAACEVARAEGAKRIILAVPVAPLDWANRLAGAADEFISLATPSDFVGVGQFFRDFTQTSDDAVIRCLDAAHEARSGRSAATTGEHICSKNREPCKPQPVWRVNGSSPIRVPPPGNKQRIAQYPPRRRSSSTGSKPPTSRLRQGDPSASIASRRSWRSNGLAKTVAPAGNDDLSPVELAPVMNSTARFGRRSTNRVASSAPSMSGSSRSVMSSSGP